MSFIKKVVQLFVFSFLFQSALTAGDIIDGQRSFHEFGVIFGVNFDTIHEGLAHQESQITEQLSSSNNNIVLASLTFVIQKADGTFRSEVKALGVPSFEDGDEILPFIFESSAESSEGSRFKDLSSVKAQFALEPSMGSLSTIEDHVTKIWFETIGSTHPFAKIPAYAKVFGNNSKRVDEDYIQKKERFEEAREAFNREVSALIKPGDAVAELNIIALKLENSPSDEARNHVFQKGRNVCTSLVELMEKQLQEGKKRVKKAEEDYRRAVTDLYRGFWHAEPRALLSLEEAEVFAIIKDALEEGEKMHAVFLHMHSRLNNCDYCRSALNLFRSRGYFQDIIQKHFGKIQGPCTILSSFRFPYTYQDRKMPYDAGDHKETTLQQIDLWGDYIPLRKIDLTPPSVSDPMPTNLFQNLVYSEGYGR